ncbi:hypothetical protein CSKR_110008 [Clonorchis sinensis]|uniref:Uncharacterized protein n=2 Tax=Clonorchis sinensis TaxID=79923 RepID=A0A8T1MQQ0_CLOSI|nr:hypothetical protein CSKR_110008 [Clonorchis sinensis]GAA55755.1 hypothetical protein CLF_108934 [Clonorchis sinensis]
MENPDVATPVKLHVNGDDIGVTTPSGGLIFNPFHREFLSRVGQMTFSPGVFAYNQSPITKDGSRRSLPFMLSPDTQGLLFPAEIDENPVLQQKLQEQLDTQCDDNVQDTIHSFFKTHLIAPSPDTADQISMDHVRCFLPRTSSMIPAITPKGKKKSSCTQDPNPILLSEVAIQTAVSMPPDFDFEGVLRAALKEFNLNQCTSPSKPNESVPDRDYGTRSSMQPSLSACTVQRPSDEDSNSRFFLCTSCRKPHRISHYSRRSLFSESSIPDDSSTRFDGEFTSQRTLVPKESLTNRPVRSTYMSSSAIEAEDSSSDGEENQDIVSLTDERGLPHSDLINFGGRLEKTMSCSLEDVHGLEVSCDRRSVESLPSTPSSTHFLRRYKGVGVAQCEPTCETNLTISMTSDYSGRRRLFVPSPFSAHREGALFCVDSPHLSPILPASRSDSPQPPLHAFDEQPNNLVSPGFGWNPIRRLS